MVHSNKILTVSYGTFSCTLEGFEDSFGTMKAIAEYFRDLAQQDRYFGAEPPQPDAEMLARIAQREIARRVEASHDGNGFVLRATDEQDRPAAALDKPAAPAAAWGAPAAGFAPEAIAAAAVAAMAGSGVSAAPEQDAAPDVAAQEAVAEAAAEEVIAEDTARDMAEEIAEVAEELEDMVTETGEDVAGIADEDQAADALEETDMAAFFGQSQAADMDDMDDMDEDIADEPVSQIRMPDISAPAEPQPATEDAAASARSAAANSIAAKLQRIRAVVAQSDAAQTRSDYVEDQHAEVAQAPAADPIAAIMGEMGRKDAGEAPAEEAVSTRLLKVSREEFEAVLIMDSAEDEAEDGPLSAQDEEDLMRELAEVEAELGLDDAARDEDDLYSPEEDDLFEDELDTIGRKDVDEEDLDAIDEDDLVEEIMDLDDEDARGFEDEDEYSYEDLIARDKDDITDEEDDFASIFAEDRDSEDETFEKDDIRDEEDVPAVAEAQDAGDADEIGARDGHSLLDDEHLDDDLARLLAETDSHMDDAEASTRRADFDHLRAAVAAQKAEDEGEPRLIAAQPDAVYRDDLAQAVRPRRPEAPTEDRVRSRRPEDERPAPLKLVAAQRVDAEPAEVRPRRVVSRPMPEADATLPDGQMSFAEFAESVGAYELPDLLEAAASYLAFVEGQDQFSRPQLMTKVRMLEPEDFSREDGLRSFGQLLRDGKIEKIQGGRFTVSDRIGFRPDDMRAAG